MDNEIDEPAASAAHAAAAASAPPAAEPAAAAPIPNGVSFEEYMPRSAEEQKALFMAMILESLPPPPPPAQPQLQPPIEHDQGVDGMDAEPASGLAAIL
ncbi:unnamed protein product [Vitrella brassicaformis CCMP3155]|uniref:Uncharacterized protein n=1 Tax=Vitrella brassicaformis (strain CCMP3155) TaxID=1169540 RepID=A0A0G4H1F7_VITBC|nr:unnamed protein product [Vitrella brassicaformis CCMP3155]|eukprot:CEM37430.1 unnamed protein product [Vitrella brassicaformis CCMP3155]